MDNPAVSMVCVVYLVTFAVLLADPAGGIVCDPPQKGHNDYQAVEVASHSEPRGVLWHGGGLVGPLGIMGHHGVASPLGIIGHHGVIGPHGFAGHQGALGALGIAGHHYGYLRSSSEGEEHLHRKKEPKGHPSQHRDAEGHQFDEREAYQPVPESAEHYANPVYIQRDAESFQPLNPEGIVFIQMPESRQQDVKKYQHLSSNQEGRSAIRMPKFSQRDAESSESSRSVEEGRSAYQVPQYCQPGEDLLYQYVCESLEADVIKFYPVSCVRVEEAYVTEGRSALHPLKSPIPMVGGLIHVGAGVAAYNTQEQGNLKHLLGFNKHKYDHHKLDYGYMPVMAPIPMMPYHMVHHDRGYDTYNLGGGGLGQSATSKVLGLGGRGGIL